MLHLLLLSVVLVCCLGAVPQPRLLGGNIIRGTEADIKDFPYQLSLEVFGSPQCGASIISEDWAITAAHCCLNLVPSDVTLRAGTSFEDKGGEVYQVTEIIVHENFSMANPDNDISVLKVATKFQFGPTVAAIPLASESPAVGTVLTVSGWGVTETGWPTEQLMQAQVPVVDLCDCAEELEGVIDITARMLCAGYDEGGKDACGGDSGSPYVANGELVGIVSWGNSCGQPNYPGVATDVANLRTWITEKIGISPSQCDALEVNSCLI